MRINRTEPIDLGFDLLKNPSSFSPLVGFFVFVYNHVCEKLSNFLQNSTLVEGNAKGSTRLNRNGGISI